MKAEIISVGTELLLGHIINEDAAYIARELAGLGIDLTQMQVVGDNPQRLEEALELAANRADIIITTGGLGPTQDDLTKEVASKFTRRQLVEDERVLLALEEYFGDRPITENQFKQALVPEGSTIFANQNGTAPGLAIPFAENKILILLPGPPAELVPMWESDVRNFLSATANKVIISTQIKTFGIGEGAAAAKLEDLFSCDNPTVAPYASAGEMFVKITAKAENSAAAQDLLAPVVVKVKNRLGDVVYGQDVPSLESVVVKELIKQRKTVTTAESCTGGLLAKRITDQPGASAIFRLGVITYANSAKEKALSVSKEILMEFGAVSEEVARAMAENARQLNNSSYGIGITGIAGPDGGTPEKPVGLVYIALAWENGLNIRKMQPRGRYLGREWVRMRAASHALDMLRRHLAGLRLDFEWL